MLLHRTSFLISTFVLTVITTSVTSCRATTTKNLITEPTSSELSGIRDQHYLLFMTEAEDQPDHYSFYVCPALKGSMASQESQALLDDDYKSTCSPAYMDANGNSVTFDKKLLTNSSLLAAGDLASSEGYKYFLHDIHKYNIVPQSAAALAGSFMLLIAFPKLANPANFRPKLISGIVKMLFTFTAVGAGGAAVGVHNTAKAKKCIRAIRNLETSAQTSAVEGVYNPNTQTLNEIKEMIQTECQGYTSDVWISESSAQVDLVDAFRDITDTNPEYVRSVSTRIPELLPLLGNMISSLGWLQDQEITYQCLPREDLLYSGEDTAAMCIPIKRSWNTGQYLYKKPPSDNPSK